MLTKSTLSLSRYTPAAFEGSEREIEKKCNPDNANAIDPIPIKICFNARKNNIKLREIRKENPAEQQNLSLVFKKIGKRSYNSIKQVSCNF